MQRACRLRCAGLSQLLHGHYSTPNVPQSSSPSLHYPTSIPTYKFERSIHIIPSSIASLRSETQWHHMLPIASLCHPLLMIQKRTKTAKKVVKRLSAPPSKLKKTKMKSYSWVPFEFLLVFFGSYLFIFLSMRNISQGGAALSNMDFFRYKFQVRKVIQIQV